MDRVLAISAKLPHTGDIVAQRRIPDAAIRLEQAGFDGLWVSDHIVLPREIGSYYPFENDGVARWSTDVDYAEALTVLAAAAAVTSTIRLGTAVLVLPIRHPVLLAKQTATIDALAPGRLRLGVGAGWLREEFAALDAPFATRGARTDEGIAALRRCWSGGTDDLLMLPAPDRPIPIYPGGHSRPALRRAGRIGDGWLGQQSAAELDVEALRTDIAVVHAAARAADRDPSELQMVLRVAGSAGRAAQLAPRLRELVAAGVTEIIVDADPFADPTAAAALLRDAAS